MMGERRVMQEALFYGFSLQRHVPDDHLLRKIDRFVDLSEVRAHLGPYYSDVGRPSIDPELMIRMLIVGYGFGIRSERRPCEEGLSWRSSPQPTFQSRPPSKLEASVDPLPEGSDWMNISPVAGSLFHEEEELPLTLLTFP